MDSYSSYRDSARSPSDRAWGGREETRVKDERDSFYRNRSPGHDRPRRSNRSRSPPPVDRYEPRTRGRDDYGGARERDRDDRRRVTSPPANIDRYVPGQSSAESTMPALASNPIPDPLKLNYQVGFSYFGEWWRAQEKIKDEKERQRTGRRREPERPRGPEDRENEKAKIQAAYDKYKEELQSKMAQTFVRQHKDEQWFRERYVPEVRDQFRMQLNEFRRGAYSQWEQDMESGTFDEFGLEGVSKSDNNGQGGVAEKEEGEATANEFLGVGDLVPVSGSEVRDEALHQPTLLIKTIAPSVSRQNLEAFCKEHLGEDEGGFKWLSLSDPNPSKRYHRIGWIMLHPAAEIPPAIDRMDPSEEDGEMALKSPVPVSTAEKALEAINGKTVKDESRGDFVCHVGVHNPPHNPRRKALWDLFSAPERIEKDLELVRRLVNKFEEDFGSDFNAILKIEEKVEELLNSGRLQPVVPSSPVKVRKNRSLGLDEAMDDGEHPEDGEHDDDDEGMVDDHDDEVDDQSLLCKKKQLDLLIEYLRRVFNFCFFCVFESDSVHELTRKCPGGHLRRPRSTLSGQAKAVARASAAGEPFPVKKRVEPTEGEEGELPSEGDRRRPQLTKSEQQLQRAYNWVKTFEEKIMQILEPESVDIRKVGGKPVEEALDEELVKYVKQEEPNKWRCKAPECTKLFKEEHFWKKHVEKRHTEWLEKLKEEVELINRYVIDPSHIAPSRTDANSNGHFPPVNGQAPSGTPRGFNLQNFAMNNILAMPGFGMQGGFPPNLFTAAMQQPVAGWTHQGGPDERSGSGPIRRGGAMGGNRFNNARSGPYDRRPNPRWGQDGMPGGAMGGGRGGRSYGGGRWGDGAGGGAAVGPREAIQGRTIKSYEDLDNVSGGGGGELNY
ncbi:hypothetical protein PspLS_04825 [Pyricularia sp. CBS 133598]|nr:hypothetical protein PspLS_04825 [Pyricularia sp. CBS 133598]